jgi:tellurite resistance protein TerC
MANTIIHEWVIFGFVTSCAFFADMAIFGRKAHSVTVRMALLESGGWIGLALGFNVWIYVSRGEQAGLQFLTGYLLEKSLSIDNLFVFVAIFGSLRVRQSSQHKVLYYGIVGALVMRAIFILGGIELIEKFRGISFVFGAILLLAGVHMLMAREHGTQSGRSWIIRVARKFVPVVDNYEGDSLWVKQAGKWNATPLFLALIAIETMDIIFAVDSVPAVLAITREPFIVFSSNAFAILGLRALYFALAGILPRLRFLHQGLAIILIFVAGKMFTSDFLKIPDVFSLAIVGTILVFTGLASAMFPKAS